MAQMDTLIRHMPFVMAAVMDARLSDLRNQLLSALLPQQHHRFAQLAHGGSSGDATRQSLQQQSHGPLHRPHGTASSLQGRPSAGIDSAVGPKSAGQVGVVATAGAAPGAAPSSGHLAHGGVGASALQAAASSESGGWARLSTGTEQGEGPAAAGTAGGQQAPAQRTASGAN